MITSNLRIPEETWKELKRIALEENRSINSEIIQIIQEYIKEYNKKKTK